MKHPHAAITPDQPARFRQLVEAGALTEQIQVISAGQQQGSVDTSATDLLKQAEEVLRAAQEGKDEEVDKKLQELQRKTEEQIDKGKVRGPAVGQVRQAVAQFSQVIRSR